MLYIANTENDNGQLYFIQQYDMILSKFLSHTAFQLILTRGYCNELQKLKQKYVASVTMKQNAAPPKGFVI